jgi:hypothetical protein
MLRNVFADQSKLHAVNIGRKTTKELRVRFLTAVIHIFSKFQCIQYFITMSSCTHEVADGSLDWVNSHDLRSIFGALISEDNARD